MASSSPVTEFTFIGQQSRLARWFARPLRRFLEVSSAGGILLLIATAIALIWINSPFSQSYVDLWSTQVNVYLGKIEIFGGHTLRAFVNDCLMVVFFFVVGLEIKRELVAGQLRKLSDAALPAFAAIGGMVLPALLFVFINIGGEGAKGWGIPMATDIAFAIGIVSLLGDRIPRKLKVFLLTLAIVDDIGAIIVIALFYSSGIDTTFLIATAAIIGLVLFLKQVRVWYVPVYVVLGLLLWWTTYRSGIHATIAGVALGLICPAKPLQHEDDTRAVARWLRDKPEVFPIDVRYANFRIRESVSMAQRLEESLHPISSFIIIPIFALANAGVKINGAYVSAAMKSPVTWGIIVGLLVGKTVGISLFTWLTAKLHIAHMPREMTFRHLLGLSMIAGIGFTVSLFVAGLAFGEAPHHASPFADDGHAVEASYDTHAGDDGHAGQDTHTEDDSHKADDAHAQPAGEGDEIEVTIEDKAKIGILAASAIASVTGLALLTWASKHNEDD